MKTLRRGIMLCASAIFALMLTALPVLAQENSQPDVTDTPTGTFFRWLNFALVAGGLAYLLAKSGPYFRTRAGVISGQIHEAAEARAQAQRELTEAEQQLAGLPAEVEELRRAAVRESAEERERIRALAKSEAERVAKAAQAEIGAAERAGRQELRAIASRLATERAAALLRQRMNPQMQTAIFRTFLSQLPRSAS